eukprot:TRINITY_DN401_c0_g1_i1.p1 TRINITY_DN401_c0_g1~~TRINITY_DN401_c0_g1_i1.p1  ORF type:complete len:206 (+),score=48.54 TRINITY_DN401_c0_g1_i1:358-975(+)
MFNMNFNDQQGNASFSMGMPGMNVNMSVPNTNNPNQMGSMSMGMPGMNVHMNIPNDPYAHQGYPPSHAPQGQGYAPSHAPQGQGYAPSHAPSQSMSMGMNTGYAPTSSPGMSMGGNTASKNDIDAIISQVNNAWKQDQVNTVSSLVGGLGKRLSADDCGRIVKTVWKENQSATATFLRSYCDDFIGFRGKMQSEMWSDEFRKCNF